MPREIALGDALVPGLLVLFVVSLALLWLLDWVAGRFGLYRLVWHPSLFRLALFVCVFGSFALLLF
jgi:protein AaeX